MLFGGPPFSDERHDPSVTSSRVVHWRRWFKLPPDPHVGEEARDLLRGLICDPQELETNDFHPLLAMFFLFLAIFVPFPCRNRGLRPEKVRSWSL